MTSSNKLQPKQTSKDFLQNSIGKSAKYFVVALVCIFIWACDSILPIYYVMGGVGNSILSKILKMVIQQPRPHNSPKGGHGMPSSHSQSISYFATVLEWKIYMYLRIQPWTLVLNRPQDTAAAVMTSLAILAYSYYACKYRIATGRHTLAQTLVGAAVGIIAGSSAYFLETQYLRIFLPEDLFPSAPLWLRHFIIITGVIVLFRKQLAKKLFKYKVEA